MDNTHITDVLQFTALPVKYFTFKFSSTGLISEIPPPLKTFCKSSTFLPVYHPRDTLCCVSWIEVLEEEVYVISF